MIILSVFVRLETMQRESSFADDHPKKRMLICREGIQMQPIDYLQNEPDSPYFEEEISHECLGGET
jgi:hypothetical protein